MTQTVLLNAVTSAGASATTFDVDTDPVTVVGEGFISDDVRVSIEKRNIADDGWIKYAPGGTPVYIRSSQQEVVIIGKGTYRVNMLEDSDSEISVASVV